MENSVFLKLVALLLALCGCLTVVAVIAKKQSGDDAGTVKVPVVTDGSGNEVETQFGDYNKNDPVDVGNGQTVVATQDDNSYFAFAEADDRVGFVFVVPDLKPGAKYKLNFSLNADLLPSGVSVGDRDYYRYRLVGNSLVTNAFQEKGLTLGYLDGGALPTVIEHSFTVDDTYSFTPDATGKATLVFLFASVAKSSGTDYEGLAKTIIPGVTFRLYEVTA